MLKVSVQTNIGKTRSVNQDTVFVSCESVGPLPNLFIVADGMGGHNGGEIASKAAITHFCDNIKSKGFSQNEGTLDLLTSAARAANMGVISQAEMNPDLSGMGTTLTACTIETSTEVKKGFIVHIGDSRAYVITSGQRSSDQVITQLTNDHSYVNEMVKAGQITQNEAREHPKRNILTKALGINTEMSADGYVFDIEPNSVILLCSDGLYNMVPEDEIKSIINNSPQEPATALVKAANDRGGTDNISIAYLLREEGDLQ